MTSILKMPRLGETMDEGQLVAWLVEFGAPFKRGDPTVSYTHLTLPTILLV